MNCQKEKVCLFRAARAELLEEEVEGASVRAQEHIHQISVFPVSDWSSRARPGHLENISLERRGPLCGMKGGQGGREGEKERQSERVTSLALRLEWRMNGSFNHRGNFAGNM